MALELIPFATATATLAPPIMLPNTPAGTRVIFEIVDYRWEGPRFTARQKSAAAADWLLLGPDGTGTLDVRVTLETPDGAVVLVHYGGRVDGSKGLGGEAPVYAAVQFETGNERYGWLNRVQAVAKGVLAGNVITYEVYELR
ncbi:MAG: DUF3237 domain-containing protein [Deltaproteobacteria bacterium]|nr:MAG: DUF3237 domain-containing protein [Deltaproteobacteria bacterium]